MTKVYEQKSHQLASDIKDNTKIIFNPVGPVKDILEMSCTTELTLHSRCSICFTATITPTAKFTSAEFHPFKFMQQQFHYLICAALSHCCICAMYLCSNTHAHNASRRVDATEWVQWLERGGMNAGQIKCNCVNVNIAIAQRWLYKCCANLVACILHAVAKMVMNVEALNIEALCTSVQKFIGSIHDRKLPA